MKRIKELQEAFSDSPPERRFKIENAQYAPESFGNEQADLCYGSLRVQVTIERGEVYADILIPNESKKRISVSLLMERFGFVQRSDNPIVNLRGFFRSEEARLVNLGEALVKSGVPAALADTVY